MQGRRDFMTLSGAAALYLFTGCGGSSNNNGGSGGGTPTNGTLPIPELRHGTAIGGVMHYDVNIVEAQHTFFGGVQTKTWAFDLIKSILVTLLIVAFVGCREIDDIIDPQSGHPAQVKNILFAHGFMSDKSTWDAYSTATANNTNREWRVYRTSVAKSGTIAERADELADYINSLDIGEDSMLVVGHSMGGLDLRYIISKGHQDQSYTNKYYRAAKTIHKIYTIATPHKGSDIAGLVPKDDGAVADLSSEHMLEFNALHPYTNSSVDMRVIEMLAFRFACNDRKSHDGVVNVDSQILDGAPYTRDILSGKHTTSKQRICSDGVTAELDQDWIVDSILDDNTPQGIVGSI